MADGGTGSASARTKTFGESREGKSAGPMRSRHVAALILGATHTAQAQGRDDASSRLLRPIDSVRIAESDTLMLARPTHIVVGPRGDYFVVDGAEARVLQISARGQVVRVLGRRGRGPGELQTPGTAAISGDSILAVMDNGQRRVVLYDLRAGGYHGSFVLRGWLPTLRFSGGLLLAGMLQVDSGTAVARHTFAGERLSGEGVLPPVIRKHPMLHAGFGSVTFTELGDDVFAAFEVSQSLFRWQRGSRVAEEIPVPALRRKGVRPELFEEMLRDPSKVAALAWDRSVPTLLSVIGPRTLGLVTLDGHFEQATFVGTFSLTVIDLSRRRVCPDIAIPAPPDPLPRITLHGDTLVVLQQGEDARGQPMAQIRRFVVRAEGCDWRAIPRPSPGGAATPAAPGHAVWPSR